MPLSILNQFQPSPLTQPIIERFLNRFIAVETEKLNETSCERDALLIKLKIIDAKLLIKSTCESTL